MMFPLGMYDFSSEMKRWCCCGRVSNDSKMMSSTRFGSKLKQPEWIIGINEFVAALLTGPPALTNQ